MEIKDLKELSGYASIDKPWQKYYSEEALYGALPQTTAAQYLKENSFDHLKTTAINYFNKKINYQQLLDNYQRVAQAYNSLGIKKDDIVSFCVPTLPESIYSFYGLNDLGAVSCWIDPRTGADRIKKCLNSTKSKVLVTIDLACPKIDKIIDETGVDTVISLPATQSLPYGLNYLYKGKKAVKEFLTRTSNKNDYMSWDAFMKNKKDYKVTEYTKDMPSAIVYTSGTTSEPKGVVISNDALNAIAYQYKMSGVPHDHGDHFLNVMPLFLLYGLACGMHMPLCLGMTDIVIPQIDFDKFAGLVKKHQPRHFMVTPTLFDKLVESPLMKGEDLSFITSAGIGGAGIPNEFEQRNNQFLEEHNCSHKLAKGYGATEGGSAMVATLSNECNKEGSAGIPLCKNTASIFAYSIDEDGNLITSDKELKYGEEGEICVSGPTNMLGYFDNPELTNQVLKTHSDGQVWLHTGDNGYIDEDGNVFVYGRIERMIIRPDGHNIYLSSIEDVISKHPAVNNCAVVGVKAEEFNQGKLPKAVIVLKDGYKQAEKEVVDELMELCSYQLPERDVAYFYEVMDTLPVVESSTKIDYNQLENNVTGRFYNANVKISDLVNIKMLKK